jgi:hypothetical protein
VAVFEKDDPRYFTTYCDKHYDRHKYRVVLKDGKSLVVDSYDLVKAIWFRGEHDVDTIEVLDKSGNGF